MPVTSGGGSRKGGKEKKEVNRQSLNQRLHTQAQRGQPMPYERYIKGESGERRVGSQLPQMFLPNLNFSLTYCIWALSVLSTDDDI